MNEKFIQMTSGWIPVSVLCLLAVALVTGQASAGLPEAEGFAPIPAVEQRPDNLDHLRLWVDAYLDINEHIELTIDAAIHAPAGTWQWRPERGEVTDHE